MDRRSLTQRSRSLARTVKAELLINIWLSAPQRVTGCNHRSNQLGILRPRIKVSPPISRRGLSGPAIGGNRKSSPPLAPNAPGEGYGILYEHGTSKAGYRPLITNAVKLNRSPMAFGAQYVRAIPGEAPVFAGASDDFHDLLFEANDALLAGEGSLAKELEQDVKGEVAKGEATNYYLYDDVDSRLSLVDVSPEGKVVPGAAFGALPFVEANPPRESLFRNPPDFSHVISSDGARVYWTDLGSGVVFVRENGSSTVQVSEHAARYWTASTDGRYALYSEGEGKASRLYRFDAEGEGGRGRREAVTVRECGCAWCGRRQRRRRSRVFRRGRCFVR